MEIQYFNSREAARILGVNVSTIKRWTDNGRLKCIKSPGGHRKFELNHLAAFLKENRKKTSQASLFPVENETDLKITRHIMKGNFNYLIGYIEKQALRCNRVQVQKVLNGLYLAQYPLHVIYDKILTPVLHNFGTSWQEGKIVVVEEHLASQTIRNAMQRLQGVVKIPARKAGRVLCMNLSGELHDIALKMVDHVLELRGFQILFSGQKTPILNLDKILEKYQPERIYLSSTYVEQPAESQAELNELCNICRQAGIELYVGGRGFDQLNIDHPAVKRRMYSVEEAWYH